MRPWESKNEELLRSKRNYVPPSGPVDAKCVLVAEQPGTREVAKEPRRPLVGDAGQELDRCLEQAKINRQEMYLTNVIKDLDHPLKHYINPPTKRGQKYTPPSWNPEGLVYRQVLYDELKDVESNLIIAMGNVSMFALTDRWYIKRWRSSVIESTLLPGRKVIPIIHTASFTWQRLKQNPKAFLDKHLVTDDLKKAKREMEFPEIRRIPRNILIEPSYQLSMDYLKKVKAFGLTGGIIDYDIELSKSMEMSCISFAVNFADAISIPFVYWGGDYFSPDQEANVMVAIAEILEDPRIAIRGQNLCFDNHFMLRKYGIVVSNMHDTMIAQHTLTPEYLKGLHFICSVHTDIPYYKDDGKFWLKGEGTWQQGWIYNGTDSIVCADAGPKQLAELTMIGNMEAYDRQRKLIPPLTYMHERGIKVDVPGMKAYNKELAVDIERLQYELDEVAGMPLNPNSFKQMDNYFKDIKGLTPYKENKKPTYNNKAMKRLTRKGYKEAELILKIRRLVKRRGNYTVIEKVDDDGRLRCFYNPVGTRFSRLSSSKSIFGTGTNLQNWPHEMLRFLIGDPGYVVYQYDMSQIENRIVAYVGEVIPMIEAFESGQDLHRLTAALIFGKHYNEVTSEDYTCPIGDGSHSERFWGKKSNHALNFGEGYKRFSLDLEIPENDGKFLVERYHTAYPQVRNNYHEMVKSQLRRNRTLTNLMGRKTVFLGMFNEKTFNEGFSCIPQGTNGDKVNEHGIEHIYYDQENYAPIELLNQVHDSIGFQIPLTVPWTEQARMLLRIKQSLERPLSWKSREFVVPADLSIGLDLHKEAGIELKSKNIPSSIELLAQKLEDSYSQLVHRKIGELWNQQEQTQIRME